MSLPPLVVQGLSRRYEGRPAVRELSFSVAEGEILGLVGPNGAGKTTTLRSVAGVLPLQEGRVVVGGHDLEAEELDAKRSLAYVPDDPTPFEVLTIREHLEFTARLYGLDAWTDRADDLLARFDLLDRSDALGSELSRGMQQKLAFCCAWLADPRVVLLDEPLSGLDPRGIRSARRAIAELRDRGAAVVLSSHLLELIEALADRILILDGGRKVFEGTLADAREAVSLDDGHSLEEIFFAATGEDERAPDAAE
ncbi:MAG: ABC transporter ATP-binding protein [Planctomycetota bacterium]